jgi:hypothetical protein
MNYYLYLYIYMQLNAALAQAMTDVPDLINRFIVFCGAQLNAAFGRDNARYMSSNYNFSQIINYCDALKDKANPDAATIAFNLYKTPGLPNPHGLNAGDMKEFIRLVIKVNEGIGKIGYIDWCRKKVDYRDPSQQPVGYNYAVNDCGYSADKLFKGQDILIITSQGNIIDTGPSSSKQGVSPWFKQQHDLTSVFLHFFGYDGVSFRFDRGGAFIDFTVGRETFNEGEKNSMLRLGNKEKNKGTQTTPKIVYKSLGDRLLVVYAWLFSIAHSQERTILTTCDNVVLLWCMILGLNCIQTQNDKDSADRVTRVTHFMSAPINFAIMISTERSQYLEHYARSIGLLTNLKVRPIIPFAGNAVIVVNEQNRGHVNYIIDRLISLINGVIKEINSMCSDGIISDTVRREQGHVLLTDLRRFKPSNLFNGVNALIISAKKIYSNGPIISSQILVGAKKQYTMYEMFNDPKISMASRAASGSASASAVGGNGNYFGGMMEEAGPEDGLPHVDTPDMEEAAAGAAGFSDDESDNYNPDIDEESEKLWYIILERLTLRMENLSRQPEDYTDYLVDTVLDKIVSNYDCNYEDAAINRAVEDVVREEHDFEMQSVAPVSASGKITDYVSSSKFINPPSKQYNTGVKNKTFKKRTKTRVKSLTNKERMSLIQIINKTLDKRQNKTRKLRFKPLTIQDKKKFITVLNALTNGDNTKKSSASHKGVRTKRSGAAYSSRRSVSFGTRLMKGGRATRKIKRKNSKK